MWSVCFATGHLLPSRRRNRGPHRNGAGHHPVEPLCQGAQTQSCMLHVQQYWSYCQKHWTYYEWLCGSIPERSLFDKILRTTCKTNTGWDEIHRSKIYRTIILNYRALRFYFENILDVFQEHTLYVWNIHEYTHYFMVPNIHTPLSHVVHIPPRELPP